MMKMHARGKSMDSSCPPANSVIAGGLGLAWLIREELDLPEWPKLQTRGGRRLGWKPACVCVCVFTYPCVDAVW